MGHTPGPWSFDGDYVESLALLKPLSVATLADCGHNTEGNGILIAAAPELLAALRAVGAYIIDTKAAFIDHWDGEDEESFSNVMDWIDAAIAKAEGRSE